MHQGPALKGFARTLQQILSRESPVRSNIKPPSGIYFASRDKIIRIVSPALQDGYESIKHAITLIEKYKDNKYLQKTSGVNDGINALKQAGMEEFFEELAVNYKQKLPLKDITRFFFRISEYGLKLEIIARETVLPLISHIIKDARRVNAQLRSNNIISGEDIRVLREYKMLVRELRKCQEQLKQITSKISENIKDQTKKLMGDDEPAIAIRR